MHPAVHSLDQITGSEQWSDRWMMVPEFVAELERQGFWPCTRLAGLSDADRQRFVRATFQARRLPGPDSQAWACIGSRYKHDRLLTREDRERLGAWNDDQTRALKAAAIRRARD